MCNCNKGRRGTAGTDGDSAYTFINGAGTDLGGSVFQVPTIESTPYSNAGFTIGQIVYVQGAGYYEVDDIDFGVSMDLFNLAYAGNNTSVLLDSDVKKVVPGGIIGATGATGATGPQGPLGPASNLATLYRVTGQTLTTDTTITTVPAITNTLGIGSTITWSGILNIVGTANVLVTVESYNNGVLENQFTSKSSLTTSSGTGYLAIPFQGKTLLASGQSLTFMVKLSSYVGTFTLSSTDSLLITGTLA